VATYASRHGLSLLPLHLPHTEVCDGALTLKRSMMSCKDLSVGEVRSHPKQCYPLEKAVPLLTLSLSRVCPLSLDLVLPRGLLLWASPHIQTTEAVRMCAGSLEF